jgi:tRNA-2-methylthio-N6-dimethylallyladenosine synthase
MKVYLETFGCQMNELDSELVRGHLRSLGYRFIDDPSTADVVLYNTCSVREQAENKAYSRIGIVGKRKAEGEQVILGVLGCMAERDGIDMLRRFPQVDLLCGPGELDKLPQLIENVRRTERIGRASLAAEPVSAADRVALAGNKSRRSATLGAAEDSLEALDLGRAFEPRGEGADRSAYVRITRGCNKFCTYCVVPNTRGAEVHRPPDHIVDECRRLADAGVIEVTLLGQTVNHYLYIHGQALDATGHEVPQVGPGAAAFAKGGAEAIAKSSGREVTTFARLLRRIHDEVPAIKRLRFVTSYPRDFGDDILQTMAECPRICRYLHVPAQSGSNRILKLMNRGYTVEEYRAFIDRAVRILPDVCIAGDIIVGFPTETDEDFQATVALLRAVPFKNNFIFKYSPRPGTVAIDRFEDDVPNEVKKFRNNTLLAVQGDVSSAVHAGWVGRTVDVLVDGPSKAGQASSGEGGGDLDSDGSLRSVPLPVAHPDGPRIELRVLGGAPSRAATIDRSPPVERPAGTVQMIGRTAGDLIVVFDCPRTIDPAGLSGSIVRVALESSGSLLLKGSMVM